VEISFSLWVTYLAIGAVNTVVGFVHRDRVATAVVVGVVVLGLLFVGAGVSFALLMRAGRNWARVVLTVVGGLSVLFLIGPVVTPLQALFQLCLVGAAIAMMFQRPANDWFRPRRPAL
jgi:TM2 domain-containing membrane protein YozV